MPQPRPRADVVSAGVVVLGPRRRVLLVHRPKYDDWSFPKGKLDPGEHEAAAAVREVEEETGLRVRLGPRLGEQHYRVTAGRKTVHYWAGRAVGETDVSGYRPNAEIDAVRWVDLDRAPSRLTHPHDVDTLREALAAPRKTRTLVVLRHAVARSRRTWRGADDRRRPLLAAGHRQAVQLVPLLAALDVRRVVTSSSTRCVATVEPYAGRAGMKVEPEDLLSEEDASPEAVGRLVRDLVDDLRRGGVGAGGLVLCSHRPVLPWILRAAGVAPTSMEKGEMVVLHLTKDGDVAASDRLLPR